MGISPLVRPTCLILGTLGLIQGLVFFTLTLLAVLVHLCVIALSSDETLDSVIPIAVGIYFQGNGCEVYNQTVLDIIDLPTQVTPGWLFIWMAIYVGVHAIWIVFSIFIMTQIVHAKKILQYFLLCWATVALGNCGMDLTLAIYFGIDLVALTSYTGVVEAALLPLAPAIMLILSLKGGTLWLINLVGSIFAVVAACNYIKHKDAVKPLFLERAGYLNRSPINAFAPVAVPRPSTLDLTSSARKRNISTVSDMHVYYLTHNEPRAIWQSPISDIGPLELRRKWEIPEPDYSPTSTVNRSKTDLDMQDSSSDQYQPNLFLPLRPSLKKTQRKFEKQEGTNI